MNEHPKGLVWIFPNYPFSTEVMNILKNRQPDEDTIIGNCEGLIIIDLDNCVMYVANEEEQKIIRLKEIEV